MPIARLVFNDPSWGMSEAMGGIKDLAKALAFDVPRLRMEREANERKARMEDEDRAMRPLLMMDTHSPDYDKAIEGAPEAWRGVLKGRKNAAQREDFNTKYSKFMQGIPNLGGVDTDGDGVVDTTAGKGAKRASAVGAGQKQWESARKRADDLVKPDIPAMAPGRDSLDANKVLPGVGASYSEDRRKQLETLGYEAYNRIALGPDGKPGTADDGKGGTIEDRALIRAMTDRMGGPQGFKLDDVLKQRGATGFAEILNMPMDPDEGMLASAGGYDPAAEAAAASPAYRLTPAQAAMLNAAMADPAFGMVYSPQEAEYYRSLLSMHGAPEALVQDDGLYSGGTKEQWAALTGQGGPAGAMPPVEAPAGAPPVVAAPTTPTPRVEVDRSAHEQETITKLSAVAQSLRDAINKGINVAANMAALAKIKQSVATAPLHVRDAVGMHLPVAPPSAQPGLLSTDPKPPAIDVNSPEFQAWLATRPLSDQMRYTRDPAPFVPPGPPAWNQ